MKLKDFGKTFGKNEVQFNHQAQWLQDIKNDYCNNATQKQYKIDENTLESIIGKLQNNKAPGTDQHIGCCIKIYHFIKGI